MTKQIGIANIGGNGSISIHIQDKWIYPRIGLITNHGEDCSINLQHTSPDQLEKIGEWFVEMSHQARYELTKLSEATNS